MDKRIEKDSLGEREIPGEVYWGIHTARACQNFRVTDWEVSSVFIRALAKVKKAACLANLELGYLSEEKAHAIQKACEEVIAGEWADQFPVDAFQGGAGTSTNMNMNEVIANRALEILGAKKSEYSKIHPLEDVNLHQSTNDVYPTALKVAATELLRKLSQSAAELQGAFQKKEKEFAEVVKIGRTEFEAAVPMTLGAEFSAFAEALGRDRWRTFKCEERLRTVNLGGTAVGTGLGAPQRYIFLVIEKLREVTGLGLNRAENLVDQTANQDSFVEVSGILKAHAVNLIKIAGDLRLLKLLGEIEIPAVQAGSSIMPGKVNPVILEAVIQGGTAVIAYDQMLTNAVSGASLQICELMPLVTFALIQSLETLTRLNGMMTELVLGITAKREKCRAYLDHARTLVTAFLPLIGYEKAAEIYKTLPSEGEVNLRQVLEEKLGKELVEKVLSPQALNSLGYKDHGKNTQ